MKCNKKYLKIFTIINILVLFVLLFTSGCVSEYTTPGVPEIDPNPAVNPENSTVSYVIVSATSSTIKVNQSLQLTVKGYNSEDEWVILDKSNIKFWTWSVQGCYDCFKDYVDLNPKGGSLTTTFSSTKAGTFFIGACYQENTGDSDIPNYTKVKVTK